MSKICKLCHIEKNESEFYLATPNGKPRNPCKKCEGEQKKARRLTDPDVKKRNSLSVRRYQAKNRDRINTYARAYNKIRKSYQRDPFKLRAKRLLRTEIESGRLTKPRVCELCGWEGKIEGHHHDYNLPLDVRWLCHICHMKQHRKYKDDNQR